MAKDIFLQFISLVMTEAWDIIKGMLKVGGGVSVIVVIVQVTTSVNLTDIDLSLINEAAQKYLESN